MIQNFSAKHCFIVVLDGEHHVRFTNLECAARTALMSGDYVIDRSKPKEEVLDSTACASILHWHGGRY